MNGCTGARRIADVRSYSLRPLNGSSPGRDLVEHDAQRPDVAPHVGRLSQQTSGATYASVPSSTPVSRISIDCVATSPPRISTGEQAEVEHLRGARLADHDVGGLQIAVDDAASVGVRQSVGDLRPVAHDRSTGRPSWPISCASG